MSRNMRIMWKINSDSNTEFEDEVRSEPPPEGTAQPTAGGATQPMIEGRREGGAHSTLQVCVQEGPD